MPDKMALFPLFCFPRLKYRLGMSLTKQKESLIRDRDRLATEVAELNKRIQQQNHQIEAYETKRLEYEEKCRELYKSLDVISV